MRVCIDSHQETHQQVNQDGMPNLTLAPQTSPAPDIDWRNAPAGARWWSIDQDGNAHWHIMAVCEPVVAFLRAVTWPAPTFDYAGDWRESLTERPATELASSMHCLLRSEA